jgi:hypothetical protein
LRRVPKGGGAAETVTVGTAEWWENGDYDVPPTGLTVDATSLYWSIPSTSSTGAQIGLIKKIDRNHPPGAVATVLATLPNTPAISLAMDTESLYWVTDNPDPGGGGEVNEVMSVPIAGGALVTLASFDKTEDYPVTIALDVANVYWAEQSGALWRVSKAGGAPFEVQSPPTPYGAGSWTLSGALALDATRAYWLVCSPDPFYGDPLPASLVAVAKDGGTATRLVKGSTSATSRAVAPVAVAVDGTSVYWVNGRDSLDNGTTHGSLQKVAK